MYSFHFLTVVGLKNFDKQMLILALLMNDLQNEWVASGSIITFHMVRPNRQMSVRSIFIAVLDWEIDDITSRM